MKRHGIHRVYRMYKKMAERKYECKVECKVTPRDHIKGMIYRRRAKLGHQLSILYGIACMGLMLNKGGEK
jgi:hypothetical protein